LGRIADLLEALPLRGMRRGETVPGPLAIAFRGVSFTHAGTDKRAVHEVSLAAEPGEVIAVVGPNGAGKSTLMDLLAGFLEPQGGQIVAGGLSLDRWDEESWRAAVTIMGQDVFLFHASLLDNIRYGAPAASPEAVAAAVDKAGLRALVDRLPQGLGTIVGDRGSKLSGGERQRVALARLLLAPGRVVIFDEPTSAVDGAALADINRLIRDLAPTRTTFVIAHRFETIAMADRIVLLDKGQVVVAGSPTEVGRHELFRRLFKAAA
jgi:ABC-type multidrug transport system fused ATPase/permease subunit